jgi:hypothetical protein
LLCGLGIIDTLGPGIVDADGMAQIDPAPIRNYSTDAVRTSRRLLKMGAYLAGFAVGGAALEPFARAGSPGMKRLHPLVPDTRSKNPWSSSSMHRPIVASWTADLGSICHHLQPLHRPHGWLIALKPPCMD